MFTDEKLKVPQTPAIIFLQQTATVCLTSTRFYSFLYNRILAHTNIISAVCIAYIILWHLRMNVHFFLCFPLSLALFNFSLFSILRNICIEYFLFGFETKNLIQKQEQNKKKITKITKIEYKKYANKCLYSIFSIFFNTNTCCPCFSLRTKYLSVPLFVWAKRASNKMRMMGENGHKNERKFTYLSKRKRKYVVLFYSFIILNIFVWYIFVDICIWQRECVCEIAFLCIFL